MDIFIGTRMHSNIFALSQVVPVIAIGYQPKTQGILRMVGMEQWNLPIEQVEVQTLIRTLDDLWARRDELRVQLQARIPALIEEANQAGVLIAEDYQQIQGKSGSE
jgi:colanic acid/amylovoran biosynthesis protein